MTANNWGMIYIALAAGFALLLAGLAIYTPWTGFAPRRLSARRVALTWACFGLAAAAVAVGFLTLWGVL